MKTQFIKASAVRQLAKDYGKRVSTGFIQVLDQNVKLDVYNSCQVHNGGKKTLDEAVAGYVGIKGIK